MDFEQNQVTYEKQRDICKDLNVNLPENVATKFETIEEATYREKTFITCYAKFEETSN